MLQLSESARRPAAFRAGGGARCCEHEPQGDGPHRDVGMELCSDRSVGWRRCHAVPLRASGSRTTKRAPPRWSLRSTEMDATVIVHDAAHDRQTETSTAMVPCPGVVGSSEPSNTRSARWVSTPGPSSSTARVTATSQCRRLRRHRVEAVGALVEQVADDSAQLVTVAADLLGGVLRRRSVCRRSATDLFERHVVEVDERGTDRRGTGA